MQRREQRDDILNYVILCFMLYQYIYYCITGDLSFILIPWISTSRIITGKQPNL